MAFTPGASKERISVRPVSIGNAHNGDAARKVVEHVARAKRAGDENLQQFEEGPVLLLRGPKDGRRSAKYLMHLQGPAGDASTCARVHRHPFGDRKVTVLTGQETNVIIATLSAAEVIYDPGQTAPAALERFTDRVPILREDGHEEVEDRHCLVVPPDSKFDVRIPAGGDHCFIADGSLAVAVTVHPDDVTEIALAGQQASNMTGQTDFRQLPAALTCPPSIM